MLLAFFGRPNFLSFFLPNLLFLSLFFSLSPLYGNSFGRPALLFSWQLFSALHFKCSLSLSLSLSFFRSFSVSAPASHIFLVFHCFSLSLPEQSLLCSLSLSFSLIHTSNAIRSTLFQLLPITIWPGLSYARKHRRSLCVSLSFCLSPTWAWSEAANSITSRTLPFAYPKSAIAAQ